MKNKYLKKYKLNNLQKIKQTYKYIYIFRYNDLTINEFISIKKKLKELKCNSLILKQNLIKNSFLFDLKGQGSIYIIYSNNFIDLKNEFLKLNKIKLIYLINNNNIYSNIKLNKILKLNNNINIIIFQPFLKFLFLLKNINKANIA